jgi:ATP-dependent DNA helicase RecG
MTRSMRSSLDDPVRYVKGVGPKKATLLRELGVETARDLLDHFPFRIDDFSRVVPVGLVTAGAEVTVHGKVISLQFIGSSRGKAFRVGIADGTGILYLVWYNMPYVSKRFEHGLEITASGRVEWRRGAFEIAHPVWRLGESGGERGPVIPVYHATQGLTSQNLRAIIKDALQVYVPYVSPLIPQSVLDKHGLLSEKEAYKGIHDPESSDTWELARRTLAFRETLSLQIALLSMKAEAQKSPAPDAFQEFGQANGFLSDLPFQLTPAQRRAIDDIGRDLTSGRTMNRLLQGDVGSGKTVVAMWGLLSAVENGWQGALMAPTEILASQHFKTFETLGGERTRTGFLSGAVRKGEREATLRKLSDGEIDILIGTHALLSPEVKWQRLGFVVTDEQHRFGVKQRLQLSADHDVLPHMLVVSATPIPRSLALTLYGDLDVSVMDSMPEGRMVVRTRCVTRRERRIAYSAVRDELSRGKQAFVVCPVISEGKTDRKAASMVKKELEEGYLKDTRIGLIHGSLSKNEINETMEKFAKGEIQVLVATTVIEVGIDIPNATCMVIEDADSFGLATLHQLRGRVGRGRDPSVCFLVASSEPGMARLKELEKTWDGFEVAEMDLRERGPGQFFGTAQHGMADLRLADLGLSLDIVAKARQEAREMLEAVDSGKASPEIRFTVERVRARFGDLLKHGRSR